MGIGLLVFGIAAYFAGLALLVALAVYAAVAGE
jgi:hypothetical protein